MSPFNSRYSFDIDILALLLMIIIELFFFFFFLILDANDAIPTPKGVAFIFLLFKTKMSENIWLLFFYLNLFKNKKKLNDNRNYNILKVLAHGITLGGEYCFVD